MRGTLLDSLIFLFCIALCVSGLVLNGKRHKGFGVFNFCALLLLVALKLCLDFYGAIVVLLQSIMPADVFEALRAAVKSVFIFGAGIYIGLELLSRLICFILLAVAAVRVVARLIKRGGAKPLSVHIEDGISIVRCRFVNQRLLYLELNKLRN